MNNRLKSVREAKNMSRSELSRRSGVSRPTIIKIEEEKDNLEIKVATLCKLAEALGEPVGELFF